MVFSRKRASRSAAVGSLTYGAEFSDSLYNVLATSGGGSTSANQSPTGGSISARAQQRASTGGASTLPIMHPSKRKSCMGNGMHGSEQLRDGGSCGSPRLGADTLPIRHARSQSDSTVPVDSSKGRSGMRTDISGDKQQGRYTRESSGHPTLSQSVLTHGVITERTETSPIAPNEQASQTASQYSSSRGHDEVTSSGHNDRSLTNRDSQRDEADTCQKDLVFAAAMPGKLTSAGGSHSRGRYINQI